MEKRDFLLKNGYNTSTFTFNKKSRGSTMKNGAVLLVTAVALILGVFSLVGCSSNNQSSFQNIPVKEKANFNQSQASAIKWN